MRDLDAHRDPLLVLRVRLLGEDLIEEVEIRRLGSRGTRQDRVEPLCDGAQPQLQETILHTRAHQLANRLSPITAA